MVSNSGISGFIVGLMLRGDRGVTFSEFFCWAETFYSFCPRGEYAELSYSGRLLSKDIGKARLWLIIKKPTIIVVTGKWNE